MVNTLADFDALFAQSDDPWGFRSRWYEARKRALTMAALPHRRYLHAFEPGCANGELSAALAERCDALLAADANPRAVALARARLAGAPHVSVRALHVPDEWPEGRFDLIVISELAYYLTPPQLARLVVRVRRSLAAHGVVLGCHWRPRIEDALQLGDEVHASFDSHLGLPRLGGWRDDDFVLDVWGADPRSVARREAGRPY